MSLDVTLYAIRKTEVFEYNVTHNLVRMAQEAGLHQTLWRPEELGFKKASELIEPLTKGLQLLKSDPDRFRKFNPENGWGSYEGLCEFVQKYLTACQDNPDAEIHTCR